MAFDYGNARAEEMRLTIVRHVATYRGLIGLLPLPPNVRKAISDFMIAVDDWTVQAEGSTNGRRSA